MKSAAKAAGFIQSGKWCGREDSNLHGLPHSDLNAARLPVPPRPHGALAGEPAGGHVANGARRYKVSLSGAPEGSSQLFLGIFEDVPPVGREALAGTAD